MHRATTSRAPTGQRQLQALLDALASDAISPGAGAAGAVALALGAGCLGKAVAIGLKHRPGDPTLLRVRDELSDIRARALCGADEDAERYEDFVRDANVNTSTRLLDADVQLQGVGDRLMRILHDIESLVDPIVAGDVLAARTLCDAFRVIEARNLRENAHTARKVVDAAGS